MRRHGLLNRLSQKGIGRDCLLESEIQNDLQKLWSSLAIKMILHCETKILYYKTIPLSRKKFTQHHSSGKGAIPFLIAFSLPLYPEIIRFLCGMTGRQASWKRFDASSTSFLLLKRQEYPFSSLWEVRRVR